MPCRSYRHSAQAATAASTRPSCCHTWVASPQASRVSSTWTTRISGGRSTRRSAARCGWRTCRTRLGARSASDASVVSAVPCCAVQTALDLMISAAEDPLGVRRWLACCSRRQMTSRMGSCGGGNCSPLCSSTNTSTSATLRRRRHFGKRCDSTRGALPCTGSRQLPAWSAISGGVTMGLRTWVVYPS